MSLKARHPLSGKVALVTGASSGIGQSIALALADLGAEVVLPGRRTRLLRAVARKCCDVGARAQFYQLDLLAEAEIRELRKKVMKSLGGIDILVHSAGVITKSEVAKASTKEFDQQYQINVRAPFLLTREFLPALTKRKGHIVFINSTLGLVGAAGLSQYAATKHALKGFADSLRPEVNAKGVRVLSIFLGRTATPMQAKVHQWEKKTYRPELLIQPRQVASVLISALIAGSEAEVTDIRMRPASKT